MNEFFSFFSRLNDLEGLIRWGGYTVLAAIVFAETGLLIGFFLPGDSLLVTAGLLASRGYMNPIVLFILLSVMAIVGDSVGYYFGKVTGPKIFKREDSKIFSKKHLLEAQAFYEKHGGKTIILARFMPIIRTFAPVVAGVGQMDYNRFLVYNIAGGIGWVGLMVGVGFFMGKTIPDIDEYIEFVIAGIILLSISPAIYAWAKSKLTKNFKV